MANSLLNSDNFAPHAFLNLAPPSDCALKLKALFKVSKVNWLSQLSYQILRSSFERKFDNTNFIYWKTHLPKAASFRVKIYNIPGRLVWKNRLCFRIFNQNHLQYPPVVAWCTDSETRDRGLTKDSFSRSAERLQVQSTSWTRQMA